MALLNQGMNQQRLLMNLEMLGQNTSQVEVILILQNLATKV